MRKDLRILMIEDDQALCEEFSRCFAGIDGIELVATTNSEGDALEYVRQLQPDAVILDLELHTGEGNGISFLSRLSKQKNIKKPYVLVNTNNSSQTTYDIARKLGADFVMYKHQQGHCPEAIAEFLLAVASNCVERAIDNSDPASADGDDLPERTELRKRILEELNKVSVSPKRKGYVYLADAIEISCGGYVPNVSALIGEKYGKSAKSVEHAMQNAIDSAFDNADFDELGKHYKARISANRISPTVMEFIGFYAAKLKKDN